MTQTSSPPTLPTEPPTTPPTTPHWLVLVTSVALLAAGPFLAFWDPSGKLNTGAAQAAVVIIFVIASLTIYVVERIILGVRKYGWDKQAFSYVWSQTSQQIDQDFLELKNLWPQASPFLKMIPGFNATLSDTQNQVAALSAKVSAASTATDMTPEEIVAAFEHLTGLTFPRVSPPSPATIAEVPPPPTATT